MLLLSAERKRARRREAQDLRSRIVALSADERILLLASSVLSSEMPKGDLAKLVIAIECAARNLSDHDRNVVGLLLNMTSHELAMPMEAPETRVLH
jgi:hypothetical protein